MIHGPSLAVCHREREFLTRFLFYSEQAPQSLVSNPNVQIFKFKAALLTEFLVRCVHPSNEDQVVRIND